MFIQSCPAAPWIDRRVRAIVLRAMTYRLSRGEPIHEAASRIADEELGAALDALRGPGDPHARVHAARRAIKRTRSLIRLVRAGLGPHAELAEIELRDAARRLALRRDAAVAADVFTRLVPEPTPALAAVGVALAAVRDGAAADQAALAAAAEDLDRVRARVAAWPDFADGWGVLAHGLRDSYRRGRAAMRAAFARPSAAAFHAWRRRVKDLWYHTLLLQRVWKDVQSAWAAALGDLAELLGDDHDLEVLRETLAAHTDLDADACRELLARADARSACLRGDARALGQRLYAERPRLYVARIRRYWRAWRAEAHPHELPAAPHPAAALPPEPEGICPGEQGLSGMS